MSNQIQIRNSTVDFLVFTRDAGEEGIEVRVQNGDVWLTQNAIGELFGIDRSVVTKHLKSIYSTGELDENSTCAKFAQVADNGKTYQYKFYSLAAIIAVGYRTNSEKATQFRTWATKVLDTFTKQGYVLDKNRLINGQIFDEDYFDHLITEIAEIRASERRFYQKITDLYSTSVDYDVNSQITKDFFATVQNKMHYAVHGNTAAEVIVDRANHKKEHMGLTSWKNAPDGKIVKTDVSVAKNYLSKDEMEELNEIVVMYLDYAGRQARRHIPMTMADWVQKLDPPKESTKAAIEALKKYGVTTKILTGDKEKVTRTICKQVGLEVNSMLLGSDINTMNDDDLMKAADVGISVDTAVDVAKESADIILLEKDLMVLEKGIIEGRKTYANMIKYIKMTASSNFGNMFSVLAASALLPFLPMESLHLIFLNLIYDLSCTAIPWDNVDEEFIRLPRKWDASSVGNFTAFGATLGFVALPGAYFAYLIPCILLYMALATSLKKAYVRHYGELL